MLLPSRSFPTFTALLGLSLLARVDSGCGGSNSDTEPPTLNIEQPLEGAILESDPVVTGTASDESGVDWIQFSLDDGDPLFVSVEGNTVTTFEMPFTSVPVGDHVIEVTASDTARNMTTQLIHFTSYEPNDTHQECVQIGLPYESPALTLTAADNDYYCFSVASTSRLAFQLTDLDATLESTIEADIFLHEEGGFLQTHTEVAGTQDTLVVQFPAGENEIDWQLPYDSLDTHYQFTVLPYTETPDRYEPNNTEAEAAKLGSNVLVEGLDLMTGDVDWFEFALETPSLVTFSFPNIDLPTHDIMLSLKSSQGSDPLETCFPQDDSGTCMSVSLNPGTYRYAIDYHTFEAGNGFYSLQVKTSASLVVPTRN